MLPINQSRKIALIAVALFTASMGILFVFTQKNDLIPGSLKTQIFGGYGGDSAYEYLAGNNSDPTVVIGAENKIAYAGPNFRALLGYDEADLKDVDFFRFVHPDDSGDVASMIAKISQTKAEMNNLGPYRIRGKNGEYKVYMASASVISNGDKTPQIVIKMKDITKSVEDINEAQKTGKPIKTLKNDPGKKIMVDKG